MLTPHAGQNTNPCYEIYICVFKSRFAFQNTNLNNTCISSVPWDVHQSHVTHTWNRLLRGLQQKTIFKATSVNFLSRIRMCQTPRPPHQFVSVFKEFLTLMDPHKHRIHEGELKLVHTRQTETSKINCVFTGDVVPEPACLVFNAETQTSHTRWPTMTRRQVCSL